MKSLLTFILFLIISENSAQQNIITAGQTEGMIVTSFNPNGYIGTEQGHNHHHYSGTENIDVNYDGINDFRLSYSRSGGLGGSMVQYGISALYENFVMTTQDSFYFSVRNIPYTEEDTVLHTVAKKHLQADTLFSSNDSTWKNGFVRIYYNYFYAGAFTKTLTHHVQPRDDPYYYFLKIITDTDTLLGYLHFSTQNKIFSYACQGNDSTVIINSVKDLKEDKTVKVYPNPFTNSFKLEAGSVYEFQLTDLLGTSILTGKSNEVIDTKFLPVGNYILFLRNEKYYAVKKLVKIR